MRHRVNDRPLEHKAKEYARRIIMEGIMLACRGMMIFTKDMEGVQHMVSGGTLMEAVYIAMEDPSTEAQDSYFVQTMKKENKIPKAAMELHPDTPNDILRWLKAAFDDLMI